MLAQDPELATEFKRTLAAGPDFARDPAARLQWFYRRTPFFDERRRLLPGGAGDVTRPSPFAIALPRAPPTSPRPA